MSGTEHGQVLEDMKKQYCAGVFEGMEKQTLKERINDDFEDHGPTAEEADTVYKLRDAAQSLGYAYDNLCPPGRELSLALTKLQESLMWAVQAITRPRP